MIACACIQTPGESPLPRTLGAERLQLIDARQMGAFAELTYAVRGSTADQVANLG